MKPKILLFLTGLCLLLLSALPVTANPWADRLPEHFAVVAPAEIIEVFEDSPEQYNGVAFPLFCGFASIYPKQNRFVFTKITDLPITRVVKLLNEIEKNGYIEFTAHEEKVPLEDKDSGTAFWAWAQSRGFRVFLIGAGREVPLDMVPQFARTCPYNSRKKPPVACGYTTSNVSELYIPYPD